MTALANPLTPVESSTITAAWVPLGGPATVERSVESLRSAARARGIVPIDSVVDTGRVLALGPILRVVQDHGAAQVLLGLGDGPVIGRFAWRGMERLFASRAGATVELIPL